ncbi:2'-5' RNA ligase family protein [Acidovorax soli]|uniref:2'-5' RNA ligase family protein n=1 Tax=Acidovorax soli TaxID=592050 RepID=UPI0032B18F84
MPDDQSLLPGIASAPGLHHHVFFAVLADADAGLKADRLCDQEMALRHLEGSKVRRERLHVTLVSLGWDAEFPAHKVGLARLAAAQVDAPAFTLRLDRCLSFQRRNARRPLVLCGHGAGVAGFLELHRSLYGALDSAFSGGAGAAHGVPSVTPHMTLIYSPSVVQPHPVEPVGWTVREFQLLYNLRGSPGPYRVLGRWTLQDLRCM